eukprot:TRINITY_DN775_c0_g2_i1.p1 TRINITY_DN775_c0_g2~~TRINITY_DN775_c0_g2_i1.p1  ORF type:complete len:551 (+),score=152.95 TRINITY_DN775_c0_g2_i1:116-1768(+)
MTLDVAMRSRPARCAAGAAAAASLVMVTFCSGAARSMTFAPAIQSEQAVTTGLSQAAQRLRGGLSNSPADEAYGSVESGLAGSLAAAAAIGLAFVAGVRRSKSRQPQVAMYGITRGQNWLRPCAKGMKPLINRPLARDDIEDAHEGWKKKYRKASDFEDIMKKTVYGKVQFQFASSHFTDQLPWLPIVPGPTLWGDAKGEDSCGHHPEDALYVRKYMEPAKFKKLELVSWEMPENCPPVCTLDELVNAGCQYGHNSCVWNPKMLPYLYSDMDGTHVFDLVQTSAQLNRACFYLKEAAAKGAKILFTGTKAQAGPLVRKAAKNCRQFYVDKRWAGGLLTNFYQVKDSMNLMKKLRTEMRQGAWQGLPEETQKWNKERAVKLWRKYQGVQHLEFLPDILVVVDEVKERNAVLEAARLGIPVISLVDSNSNPFYVDLPIPCNCSSTKSIDLVLSKISDAIKRGKVVFDNTSVGDRPEFEKEFDPWIFSKDRLRWMRRKSKRQPWHKAAYGNYENFKQVNPFGYIPQMQPWFDVQWEFRSGLNSQVCKPGKFRV